jgi:hypothetical protein
VAAEPDVREVEEAVRTALQAGSPQGLTILGYGEITLVIGWPSDKPKWALKRLPLFDDRARLDAYRACFDSYTSELSRRGVRIVESEFSCAERDDDRYAAYVVQPVIDEKDLLVERLAGGRKEEAKELLGQMVEIVCGAVDDRLGMDAQVSNWAIREGGLWYFDISTPMMRDSGGRDLLDVDVFLASLPAVLRIPVKRFVAGSILQTYFDKRSVLVDIAANFYKDGIEHLIPVFLDAVDDRVSPPITQEEALAYHRRDAVLWSTLQRARRADRWWQKNIRRRQYPFLLPPTVYAGRKAQRG